MTVLAFSRVPRAVARAPFRLGAVLAAGAVLVTALPVFARSAPESFADLAARVTPAVVNVKVELPAGAPGGIPGAEGMPFQFQFPPGSPFQDFFEKFFGPQGPMGPQMGPQGPQQGPQGRRGTPRSPGGGSGGVSVGSGFVIDAKGLIVTNNHVVGDDAAEGAKISVQFTDGKQLPATLLGRDPKTDLALLKVDAGRPLAAVPWGDSDKMRQGDWVLAVGNPFGLGGSVTAGVVSARGRDIGSGPYDDFIQLDAAINRGNSGGPSFNMDGQVIGINTAIYSPNGGSVGIGFAIPANLAKDVIAQLERGGTVQRGFIGVQIQSVTPEIAESLGMKEPKGALVAEVNAGGPAAAAGVRSGDVIVAFGGQAVEDSRALPRLVAAVRPGERRPLTVLRKGKEVALQITVAQLKDGTRTAAARPQQAPGLGENLTVEDTGLSLAPVSPDLRRRFSIAEAVKGAVVVAVQPDSPAARHGIRSGDVIVAVNQEDTASPSDVADAIGAARKSAGSPVLLKVQRAGTALFVPMRLKPA